MLPRGHFQFIIVDCFSRSGDAFLSCNSGSSVATKRLRPSLGIPFRLGLVMISRKHLFSFFALYASIVSSVFAGSQTGQVTDLTVRASDGLVYLELSGTHADRPDCAAQHTYWMIKDEKSLTGKQQLALVMQAQATGQQVTITGTGACTRWIDGEDIDGVHLVIKQ
jgi:hypothetical protein